MLDKKIINQLALIKEITLIPSNTIEARDEVDWTKLGKNPKSSEAAFFAVNEASRILK